MRLVLGSILLRAREGCRRAAAAVVSLRGQPPAARSQQPAARSLPSAAAAVVVGVAARFPRPPSNAPLRSATLRCAPTVASARVPPRACAAPVPAGAVLSPRAAQRRACHGPKRASARPGLESEAKPAAALPCRLSTISNSAPNHTRPRRLRGPPLARPLQASRGVHFDLQASVMAGCQCLVLVFWSGLLDVPLPHHHHTFLATQRPSSRLHAAPEPQRAAWLDTPALTSSPSPLPLPLPAARPHVPAARSSLAESTPAPRRRPAQHLLDGSRLPVPAAARCTRPQPHLRPSPPARRAPSHALPVRERGTLWASRPAPAD